MSKHINIHSRQRQLLAKFSVEKVLGWSTYNNTLREELGLHADDLTDAASQIAAWEDETGKDYFETHTYTTEEKDGWFRVYLDPLK